MAAPAMAAPASAPSVTAPYSVVPYVLFDAVGEAQIEIQAAGLIPVDIGVAGDDPTLPGDYVSYESPHAGNLVPCGTWVRYITTDGPTP